MGDLAWERNLFFPKPVVKELFPGIQPCTIFLQHYTSLSVFSARFFFPRKQSAGYFFLKSPIPPPPPPLKVKWSARLEQVTAVNNHELKQ